MFLSTQESSYIGVSGMVVDADTDEPLTYCNVYLEGTEFVASTDEDGAFLIRVPESYLENILVAKTDGYDAFYMPLSKVSGEYIIIKLRKTPLWMRDGTGEKEMKSNSQTSIEFVTISHLRRKSRLHIIAF
jgi:hypothetical protein